MAPLVEQDRPLARRLLSREIVKVPRAIARRTSMEVARCQYALRPARSPEETVRRALMPGADLASFRAGPDRGCRFFFAREDLGAIVESLDRLVPGWRTRAIGAAERICDHELRLLWADSVRLGANMPWHEDVLNGYAWKPGTFYKRVPVPYDRADMKVPWELARCQHLTTLGMAYAATGDERFAQEVMAQIDDFIARNPQGYGINWASTMDVAIRAANWLWAYELVAGARAVTHGFLTRLVASLVGHATHIEDNVSVYEGGVTTNHTVADYAGLVYLGLMMPELRDAARWTNSGIAGLAECMRVHTSSDGVDYENSTSYHRLVTEMYLGALVLAERNGRSFPGEFRESLERMVEFIAHYTTPDGRAPLVGDSDDGRWHLLGDYFGWDPRDHRHLLGTAAAVFDRPDFAAAAGRSAAAVEEAAWLAGPNAAEAVAQASGDADPSSRAFRAGGRYVMRHGEHHALVSTDEVGTNGFGNHKHNDILSYELVVNGCPVVADCGSYAYLADRASRDAFRATRAHNTLVVDGVEQNSMTDPFRMRKEADVVVHEWHSDGGLDFLDASHSGYLRLPEPVRHRRRIAFLKSPFAWLVVDTLEGRGKHAVESSVHLAPHGALSAGRRLGERSGSRVAAALEELSARVKPERVLVPSPDAAHLYTTAAGGILVVPLNWELVAVEEGWVAPRYGQRLAAPVLRMSAPLGPAEPVGYLLLEGWDAS